MNREKAVYHNARKYHAEDEEYLAGVAEKQDNFEFDTQASGTEHFGARVLQYVEEIDTNQQTLSRPDQSTRENLHARTLLSFYETHFHDVVKQSFKDFVKRAEYSPIQARMLLGSMLADDEELQMTLRNITSRLRQLHTLYSGKELSPEWVLLYSVFEGADPHLINRAYTLIKRGKLPTDIWIRMLKKHRSTIRESKQTYLDSQVPKAVESFLARARTLHTMRGCVLPPMEVIEKKIDRLLFTVQDSIEARFEDRSGHYAPSVKGVSIDVAYLLETFGKEFDSIFVHEIFHALSGHTPLMFTTILPSSEEYDDFDDEPITFESAAAIQVGFRRYGKLRWLNEAFTEYMTSLFTGRKSTAYVPEVALFEHLMKKGKKKIPLKVFADAYFEDYDPIQKPTIPKWRALRRALNASFHPRILKNIEESIAVRGAQKTLYILEHNGPL